VSLWIDIVLPFLTSSIVRLPVASGFHPKQCHVLGRNDYGLHLAVWNISSIFRDL
jgi:hypothetical protein